MPAQKKQKTVENVGGGGVPKRRWTEAEDKQLIETVVKFGDKQWSLIASHMTGREGKRCRERWKNHLCGASAW